MALTYNVYRDGVKIASDLTETEYTDTDLTPNTTYEYQVSAENEYGESPLSSPISVTTNYSPVSSVELNKNSLELEVGQSETLIVTISPETANQDVVWSSSDESVATVDDNGLVEAVGEGTATIKVESSVDSSMSDTCSISVTAPVPDTPQGLTSTGKTDTTVDLQWDE